MASEPPVVMRQLCLDLQPVSSCAIVEQCNPVGVRNRTGFHLYLHRYMEQVSPCCLVLLLETQVRVKELSDLPVYTLLYI